MFRKVLPRLLIDGRDEPLLGRCLFAQILHVVNQKSHWLVAVVADVR
jgi:hypothetical protein